MNDLDFSSWTCPLPLRDYPKIVFGQTAAEYREII
jgi:hypothetical protein